MEVFFITHPEVEVAPGVPVPEWGLSAAGRARVRTLLAQPWVPRLTRIVSSTETKALETARALADHVGLAVHADERLGENDRSATGYLPPAEFEAVADAFFARPDESIRGWERAVDAQRRVVDALGRALTGATGDTAVVAHGGVGTLLLCHLLGVPIDRRHDQPGQGSYFRFDPVGGQVRHGWRRIRGRGRGAVDGAEAGRLPTRAAAVASAGTAAPARPDSRPVVVTKGPSCASSTTSGRPSTGSTPGTSTG